MPQNTRHSIPGYCLALGARQTEGCHIWPGSSSRKSWEKKPKRIEYFEKFLLFVALIDDESNRFCFGAFDTFGDLVHKLMCDLVLQKKLIFVSTLQFLLLGGLLGWLAWGDGPEVRRLAWILVLPLGWGMARTRVAASMLVMGYFLASTRGLPVGALVFFGDSAPQWFGWVLWGAACALLTAPFCLLWSPRRRALDWRFPAAAAVSVIPPLAIIGWVNPLAVAGVIFPGFGWAGVVLALGMMSALAVRHWKSIAVLALVSIIANWAAVLIEVKVPSGWQGVDTNFSGQSGAGNDAGHLLASMRRVAWLNQFATTMPANSVRVLPENILGTLDGVAEFSLQATVAALNARGSRLLVGAEVPQPNGQFKNVVMVLGANKGDKQVAIQNIPVPYSMWKPWTSDGAVADLFGRQNWLLVNGLRAGVVVCYEETLAYSLMWMMINKPDLIVAVSNVWWARNTSVPNIQRQMTNSFGRLFGVPVVDSRNF